MDLIEAKFDTLKVKWSDVQVKNDVYLTAAFPDDEGEAAQEDTWINDLEEKFEVAEKAKFDYVRDRKQQYEDDSIHNKSMVEEHLIKEKSEIECKRKKAIRDMYGKLFHQEVNALEELMKLDEEGTMKTHIEETLKDVKLQLERCREAHVLFMDSSTRDAQAEDTAWIEELYRMRSEVNRKAADHIQRTATKKDCIIKLEKMKLPNFNGDIRTYAKFKSDFNKYIMPATKSNESASYILRSCLSERVKAIIINVEDKIGLIWKRLDEKFGDPSKLADMVINDVRKIRCVREGDIKGFINLVETTERGYRDLALLGLEKEISNTGSVSMIEERLPRDIRREWSKKVMQDGSTVDVSDKFPALMKFLLEQRKIIEYEYSDLRNSNNESYRPKIHYMDEENSYYQENAQVLQMSSNVQRCIVHNDSSRHTTQECQTFKGMDIQTRIQLVKDRRGCWSCLKTGHRSVECRFRKVCEHPNCGRYHHSLLHEVSGTENQVLSLDTKGASDMCLLPLMNVQCKGKNLNVLWDTGATISLITFRAAKDLGLAKGAKRYLTVVKVGGCVEEIDSHMYMLPLTDERNNIIHVQVYGVERISSNINRIDISGMISLIFKVSILFRHCLKLSGNKSV